MPNVNDLIQCSFTPKQAQAIADQTGWCDIDEEWSYASASTITVPSDATTRFQIGDRLRLNNTTTKYFYVIGVSATVLTVTGGSDYAVANSVITNIAYSRVLRPFGFPDTFNWSPRAFGALAPMTYTDGGVTVNVAQFSMLGRIITGYIDVSGTTGGTASGGIIFQLPATTANERTRLSVCCVATTGESVGFIIPQQAASNAVVYVRNWGNWAIGGEIGFSGWFDFKV